MILDSSVILSILMKEPDYQKHLDRLLHADYLGVSTGTLLETAIVCVNRFGPVGLSYLERFVHLVGATEIPFGSEHWREAAEAFVSYGKGRHPAALNFGDCMSYAAARLAEQELVYIGTDFSKTDKAGENPLDPT